MGSTLIEKYSTEHYAEVNRIFSEGTKEQVNKGIQLGLRNQTIQGLLALAFTMGAFFSWFHAWIFLHTLGFSTSMGQCICLLLHLCLECYRHARQGVEVLDNQT